MSMNKTCPISNFTSEERSDGMKSLLFQNWRFNEPIPIQDIALTANRHSVTFVRFSSAKKLPEFTWMSVRFSVRVRRPAFAKATTRLANQQTISEQGN